MIDKFMSSDFLIISLLLIVFTLIIASLMLLLKSMVSQNKELISTIRNSYEKQIYMMNDRLTASMDRWKDVNHLLLSSQAIQPAIDPTRRVNFSSFLKANGIHPDEIEPDPKLVFVLTPFNDRYDEVFETISGTCQSIGLHCLRGDEQFIQGDILQHILKLICKATIVIACIEGRNPNVFYELGLAHAMDKSTLLISKTVESLPIDIKSKKIIVYKSRQELKGKLKDELLRIAFIVRQRSAKEL